MKTNIRSFLVAAALITAACGSNSTTQTGKDMATTQMMTSPPDMAPPACVKTPVSGTDFLNACTSAQSGDPAKDQPYFPSLAPGGNLPPLQ